MSEARFPAGLPFFATGTVVQGFGRGSKELGIPTANFPDDVVNQLPPEITTGIYFGFAQVSDDPTVHKMAMSIGLNPFYKGTKKTMETHIMHNFDKDFYGSMLKVCILGYIRPEENYDSLEALIEAIQSDINFAKSQLDLDPFAHFKKHPYFGPEGSPAEVNGYHSNL